MDAEAGGADSVVMGGSSGRVSVKVTFRRLVVVCWMGGSVVEFADSSRRSIALLRGGSVSPSSMLTFEFRREVGWDCGCEVTETSGD